MKIVNIVGARPNLMKIAPIVVEMERVPELHPVLVHTGQHYDEAMSRIYFRELGIPPWDGHATERIVRILYHELHRSKYAHLD